MFIIHIVFPIRLFIVRQSAARNSNRVFIYRLNFAVVSNQECPKLKSDLYGGFYDEGDSHFGE